MAKRSPEDILRDIEASDIDDAMERVASMTPDERRRELEAAGFDMNVLHARADGWHRRFQGGARQDGERPPAGAPQQPDGTQYGHGRAVFLIATAALAAVLVGLLVFPQLLRKEPESAASPPTATPPATRSTVRTLTSTAESQDGSPGDAGRLQTKP
jgi:hypothetical protein